MKNAKNVHPPKFFEKKLRRINYWQIDNRSPKICGQKGAEVLPAKLAWQKYYWTRKYFKKKPREGYFIWIKEQPNLPLSTCVNIASRGIQQALQNLLVVEKDIEVKLQGTCSALKKDLTGTHRAIGKFILKGNSVIQYEHFHSWGKKDIIELDYEFFLERGAKLDYSYNIFSSPKKSKIRTVVTLFEGSSLNLSIRGNFSQTKSEIEDILFLKGKNSSGIVKLRLAGDKNSEIIAHSEVKAEAESRGHLDCQGILVDKKAKISLIPEIICQNKNAQLTHEASIGRVSEEELTYLRMRGLSEKEAINLIVSGFLAKY